MAERGQAARAHYFLSRPPISHTVKSFHVKQDLHLVSAEDGLNQESNLQANLEKYLQFN